MKYDDLVFFPKKRLGGYQFMDQVRITINGEGYICFSVNDDVFTRLWKPLYIIGAYANGRIYLEKSNDQAKGFKVHRANGYRYYWRFPAGFLSGHIPTKNAVGCYELKIDDECGLPYIEVGGHGQ